MGRLWLPPGCGRRARRRSAEHVTVAQSSAGSLTAAVIAALAAPTPAHGYLRAASTSAPVMVRVANALPVAAWPPGPQVVPLHKGAGVVAGTLINPNGFHRWVHRPDLTIAGTSKCQAGDFALTPLTGQLPAGGATLAPYAIRAWSYTVTNTGHQRCDGAVVTVSYPTIVQ